MFLGIEIGGTKLQVGVGDGTGRLKELLRRSVDRSRGATGILDTIESAAGALLDRHSVRRIGIGFGGPVVQGRVITSHHISGWDGFDFPSWIQDRFALPVVVDNDCNVAALAEALQGAGQRTRAMFYVTVGTGIGGGLITKGRIFGQDRPAVAEIGHLRPGLEATDEADTVESKASGSGIETEYARHGGSVPQASAEQIMALARSGDPVAGRVVDQAIRVLGWSIAQTVTLIAPEMVVIGGGVSLAGEPFFEAVRKKFRAYAFGPLRESVSIVPAALGEEVVVHGAIQLARIAEEENSTSEP